MYVQIEATAGQSPIIRIILDWDEKEIKDTDSIRKLLMDASLSIPRDKGKLTWIRLEKPGKGS